MLFSYLDRICIVLGTVNYVRFMVAVFSARDFSIPTRVKISVELTASVRLIS